MPIHNKIPTPNLKSLITSSIKETGLSRSQVVQQIGYTNISKGCRRLNTFLNTLEAPSEEFIDNLLTVLDIDCITFYKSIYASLDQFNIQAKKKFTPHIQIILDIEVRPLFASQMIKSKCSTPVPSKLQEQPFSDEIRAISTMYKNHSNTVLSENITKHIIGFEYHREHNYYMRFDADFILEDIVFVQTRLSRKKIFGNQLVDMLSENIT